MGHHPADVPLGRSAGRLPRVCVITGSREDVIDHPLELHLPGARAHRVVDLGGAKLLEFLAGEFGVKQEFPVPADRGWQVWLPFSRTAACRQQRDQRWEWVTSGLALYAPPAAFVLLLLERCAQGESALPKSLLVTLPLALLVLGLAAWGLHRFVLAAPAVRLLRFHRGRAVLLVPSQVAADALSEHTAAVR